MGTTVSPEPIQEPVSVDDNSGSLTVDAPVGTPVRIDPTGTTTQPVSGTITANLAAGVNNIGDVDVLTIAAGDNNIGNVDIVTMPAVDTELPAAVALAENAANPTVPAVGAFQMVFDGVTWDRAAGTSADGALVNLGANNDVTVTGTVTVDSELPAAAALGDNAANPTAPAVGAFGLVWDGATWDRAAGTSVDGALVNLGANNDVTVTSGSVTAVGGAAHASPVSGNPNLVAGRASTAVPTDVGADGDAASLWTNRNGAQMVSTAPHVGLNGDPWSLVHEAAQYTTTQTTTVLIAGGASEKLVVTKVQIQVGGTTAGTLQLFFGTAAYSRGTSRAIFDGEFAPSATLKPGVVMDGPFIAGTNGDDLLVTTSAAINPLTISVWYYVII